LKKLNIDVTIAVYCIFVLFYFWRNKRQEIWLPQRSRSS